MAEPGMPAAGGAGPAEPLHAYLLDEWRAAQPVPLRLRALLGPGPALATVDAALLSAPAPALPATAALAVYDAVLDPEASEALVAVAVARAATRADAVVGDALGAVDLWRLDAPFSSLQGSLPRPVRGRVDLPFGPVRVEGLYTTVRHTGVTYGVETGADVRAVARGIVCYAGELNGYGLVVIMDHGTGYHTVYAYLSRVEVRVGALVEANEVLGATGSAAPGGGGQLYFEIRHLGDPLDPADWIDLGH